MHRLTIAVLFCCPAIAQTTWIVDASGGGQFTDIQPAIQVARSGDRIEVRTGSYGAFLLQEGIDLAAVTTPVTVPFARIESIPPGQRAVLDGFDVADPSETTARAGLALTNNRGAILIRSTRVTRPPLPSPGIAVTMTNCGLVRCVDCEFTGGMGLFGPGRGASGLSVRSCTVQLLDTVVTGGATLMTATAGVDGMRIATSSVALAGCRVAGGAGGPSTQTLGSSCWVLGPGGPGGSAIGGDGRVTAAAGCDLRGGAGGAPNPIAGNCAGTQGPAVTFTGRFDASADTLLVGATSSGVTSIPFQPILGMPLHADRGTTVRAPVTTRPSANVSLFVDPSPGGVLWIPGLDAPFVLSAGAAPILALTTTAGGTGTFAIALPLAPVFRELDLSFQVVTAAAAAPMFRLSNLGVLRVH